MQLAELKMRFLLQSVTAARVLPMLAPPKKLVQAAVLMPFFQTRSGAQLLLTRRAAHLNAHPGQISFPGGKHEGRDGDLITTALRETQEEIGIHTEQIEVLGCLHSNHTLSGFSITPVVAIIHGAFTPTLDKNEVAECFSVPWQHLMQAQHRHTAKFRRQGQDMTVGFIPYQDKFIWGATAAMIDQLALQLADAVQ
ncbi:MAG: CoA pyrophosphatase [Shewanella sp.]|uniref:CoA pyrophosphatase n=1 Tax=Shewanella sp. SNU WT4 TaxID=2590015 RepID=UPI00112CA62A|nr:CoA pyrophosphatase [Shewanella sp. SNU WT4]QDF67189.1 CoA pyrophosphatase [Shewanella sp. SNU WT4]